MTTAPRPPLLLGGVVGSWETASEPSIAGHGCEAGRSPSGSCTGVGLAPERLLLLLQESPVPGMPTVVFTRP